MKLPNLPKIIHNTVLYILYAISIVYVTLISFVGLLYDGVTKIMDGHVLQDTLKVIAGTMMTFFSIPVFAFGMIVITTLLLTYRKK